MKALTREEYKTYLTANGGFPWGIKVDDDRGFSAYYSTPDARATEVLFPSSASEFSYLASTLALEAGGTFGGGTLVYDDWGVWDENGNLAGYQMIERIRSTFGELRPFDEAPAHVFRQDEQHLLTNFILAALVYGWDAWYIPNREGWFAHISHDGYCLIATKRAEDFEEMIKPKLDDPTSGYRVMEQSNLVRSVVS